uniref:Metalloendopeptidase n=1 Tax=viral metagenome TaxID=1070528 RepID=A0A6C0JQM8_9ZZZZ
MFLLLVFLTITSAFPVIKNDIGYFEELIDGTIIFEGDMMLPKNVSVPNFVSSFQKTYKESEIQEKNAVRNKKRLWPNGVVFYNINETFSGEEIETINDAFKQIENQTCIKFVERTYEKDYIEIFKGYGCYSYVGFLGGEQGISIGDGCIFKGTILHELMHVLGFYHEQSRTDRDEYVKIIWDNIIKGQEVNFKSYTQTDIDHMGQPYDYKSIMHYTRYAFSKNDGESIHPYVNVELVHSSLKFKLSDIDAKKINILYNCDNTDNKDKNGNKCVIAPVISTTIAPDSKLCKDKLVNCKSWASAGQCDNGLFMILACPNSCKTKCIESNECKDYHTNCNDWITDGKKMKPELCTEYLNIVCPLSCKNC